MFNAGSGRNIENGVLMIFTLHGKGFDWLDPRGPPLTGESRRPAPPCTDGRIRRLAPPCNALVDHRKTDARGTAPRCAVALATVDQLAGQWGS
ncbi:uncharacterized protein G2W53_041712 [Senna tora]|uniref:Uncharacterized protein n=1 Tax=Senna tora TaxID=362788 RepID=A0A834SG50_9FABA|nr:uncharacterized protein G2W53_041712 [Senna tora]